MMANSMTRDWQLTSPRQSVDNQGFVLNYAKVIDLLKNGDGMIEGIILQDQETGKTYKIKGRSVVNATGVFVDQINNIDTPGSKPLIVPSQGVHLVLDKSFLRGSHAIMIPKTSDDRVLFAVPWHEKVVVGTTDTKIGEISIEPRALEEEVEFILQNAAQYLEKSPGRADVKSVFAGLRPLAASQESDEKTKEISRSHKLVISQSGMITVIGGKWTTYRKMGEDIIDKALLLAGLEEKTCVTKNMPVHGYVKHVDRADHLYVYGSDLPKIKSLLTTDPELNKQIDPRLPYYRAEVVWAVREEMARTIEDVLARRTRALLLDAEASIAMAPIVAELIAKELGYSEVWVANQISAYTKLAKDYLLGQK